MPSLSSPLEGKEKWLVESCEDVSYTAAWRLLSIFLPTPYPLPKDGVDYYWMFSLGDSLPVLCSGTEIMFDPLPLSPPKGISIIAFKSSAFFQHSTHGPVTS